MKALVYNGPGKRSWEEKPKPEVQAPTDAIVRITKTTICGTDLHILKGDVASVKSGRILGHEATPSTARRPNTCVFRTPTIASTPCPKAWTRARW
jgi:hypothetical protein